MLNHSRVTSALFSFPRARKTSATKILRTRLPDRIKRPRSMNGTLTIFHTTIANSEMLENSRYSVTNNYLTNFETCLMPLDISLHDIERYTVYRVNRIGRGCIAYRIILYIKPNTYVRTIKLIYVIRKNYSTDLSKCF